MVTVFGVCILSAPVLFVGLFKDKVFGFFVILLCMLAGHVSIAMVTQMLGVFSYPVVLLAHSITLGGGLFYYRKPLRAALPHWRDTFRNPDWIALLVLGIAFLHLYQVHFNYSGDYSPTLGTEYQTVEGLRYPFPYFADEWYAAGFAKEYIAIESFSAANPIDPDTSFSNVQFPFHALLAELCVLLNLDPVQHYGFLALGFSWLTITLLYWFLVGNHVAPLPAGVASMLALYIPNSGTFPGLWTLFPFTVGVIGFLIGLYFLSQKSPAWLCASIVLTFLFYPPLILFYLVALAVWLGRREERTSILTNRTLLRAMGAFLAAGVVLIIGYLAATPSLQALASFAVSKIFFTTFWHPGALNLPIMTVVPIAVLILLPFGMRATTQKLPWLLATWCSGLLLWCVYSLTSTRVLIEHERVVLLTAYLSVLLAGFGLALIVRTLQTAFSNQPPVVHGELLVGLLVIAAAAPFYTYSDTWQKLTLTDHTTGHAYAPAAFANQHLTDDDVRIFAPLTDARFLSHPWKGTVLGIATTNEPLTVKTGTIARNPDLYTTFLRSDCTEKQQLVDEYHIEYVYTPAFQCDGFAAGEKSAEGFVLYKTTLP